MKKELNKKYCVYIHRNIVNNKVYIGQTCQKPYNRWGKNGKNYLKRNKDGEYIFKHFGPAIIKYGWDNFEHAILISNLSKEEADAEEIKLIEEYQACNNKYGYNCKTGGANGIPSDESRKRMSESHIGKNSGSDHPRSKQVICLETKEKYNSMRDADKAFGLPFGTISSCINGFQNTAKDLHWLTVEDYNIMSLEEIQQYILDRPNFKEIIHGDNRGQYCGRKSVINIITGEVFVSIKEAQDAYGDDDKYITRCCNEGITHIAKNYWAYNTISEKELEALKEHIYKLEYEQKIILLETNVIYKNAKEAATLLNLDIKCIQHCCNGYSPTYDNKHWMYLKEYDLLTTKEKQNLKEKIAQYNLLILCEDTGKTYKSFIDAENDTGIDAWCISRVCKKVPGRLTAGGMHWSFTSKEG